MNADGQVHRTGTKVIDKTPFIRLCRGAVLHWTERSVRCRSTTCADQHPHPQSPARSRRPGTRLPLHASSVLPQSEYESVNEFVAAIPPMPTLPPSCRLLSAQERRTPHSRQSNADYGKALRVSNKKDDVHYNIARLIYSYQLSKPKETYRDWTYDRALKEITAAQAIDSLPVYIQLEGDILFAAQQYAAASQAYLRVTRTALASPASFYSAAKAKNWQVPNIKEVVALMDSCVNRCVKPFTARLRPILLERARVYMDAEMYRPALTDYDTYYETLAGRCQRTCSITTGEQAAFKGKTVSAGTQ